MFSLASYSLVSTFVVTVMLCLIHDVQWFNCRNPSYDEGSNKPPFGSVVFG